MKFIVAGGKHTLCIITALLLCRVWAQTDVERANSLALILASIQCFPAADRDNGATHQVMDINRNFDPEAHFGSYKNGSDVRKLLDAIKKTNGSEVPDNPFTNSPVDISQLRLVLGALYQNSDNWPLFFNTSAWLLDRVNGAQLFWALMIVAGDKFDTVTVPSVVEVFPQLFIPKEDTLQAANLTYGSEDNDAPLLQYWRGDPGLNEFHTHWHIDNPFWWDEKVYGVQRYRRGELFVYMHHQIVNHYNAELLSNGLSEVTPLELDPDYQIPEGYVADIVNVNFKKFPDRKPGERIREWDDGKSLSQLKTWFDRLQTGIERGYFTGQTQGSQVSLAGANNADILGNTVESSNVHSANVDYYGSFHNYLHRELAGFSKPRGLTPGVEAHSETSMRDPVFYRLHKKIDTLWTLLKKTRSPPYTKKDLDFPGVSIKSLEVQTPRPHDAENETRSVNVRWPFTPAPGIPTINTYFTTDTYDISNAARPCRAINDEPVKLQVKTLTHVPFKYVIGLHSTRSTVAYGMVRIFMWPEAKQDGKRLEVDEAHQWAIELDRFRVKIDPNRDTVIMRESLNSSITRPYSPPGIKVLYNAKESSNVLRAEGRRACGFPNNLLIPKGNKDGIKFNLVVYVSDETESGWVEDYPNFPLCGALGGNPFPDSRPMGFPFDRPGTRFIASEGFWPVVGSVKMKNVKELRIVIKHE